MFANTLVELNEDHITTWRNPIGAEVPLVLDKGFRGITISPSNRGNVDVYFFKEVAFDPDGFQEKEPAQLQLEVKDVPVKILKQLPPIKLENRIIWNCQTSKGDLTIEYIGNFDFNFTLIGHGIERAVYIGPQAIAKLNEFFPTTNPVKEKVVKFIQLCHASSDTAKK